MSHARSEYKLTDDWDVNWGINPYDSTEKDDQKERTYDLNGIAPFGFTTLGVTYLSLRSNNRSYNIYINIWRSTAARYCSSWEKISRPPATTRISHPIRERDAKTEWVNRYNQAKKIMLIDLPTWKSTRRPCPRYKIKEVDCRRVQDHKQPLGKTIP